MIHQCMSLFQRLSVNQKCTITEFQSLVHIWPSSWSTTLASLKKHMMTPSTTTMLLTRDKNNRKLKKLNGIPNKLRSLRREKKLEKSTRKKKRIGKPMSMLISEPIKFNLLCASILWDKTDNSLRKKLTLPLEQLRTTEILGKHLKFKT